MIYYIQEGSNIVGEGFIKIGRSRNPLQRLAQLQSANPRKLYLLFVSMPADLVSERELEAEEHERFQAFRVPGTEWFYPAECLRRYLFSACPGFRGDSKSFKPPAIDPADVAEEVHGWLEESDGATQMD